MKTRHAGPTLAIEPLDGRLVLSAVVPQAIAAAPVVAVAHASTVIATPVGTTMEKAGQALDTIYQQYTAYVKGGSVGAFAATGVGQVKIANGYVGVDLRVSGNVNTAASELKQIGMLVTGIDAATGTVEGSLPIGQIPSAAVDAAVIGMTPIYQPTLRATARF